MRKLLVMALSLLSFHAYAWDSDAYQQQIQQQINEQRQQLQQQSEQANANFENSMNARKYGND